ncbi:BrnT family toxin [Microbaculum marinum]|uniref:BrnT family toxin n=1 Tax=Microbaculum marinum TaxID=1764581 RepID=A0AAW9RX79_9HYPH
MEYEWDPRKAAANVVKHGVAFEHVVDFQWESARLGEDRRHRYGEKRFIALGLIGERVHVVIFTLRGTTIRIISLRKANERERRSYERA